MVISQITLPNKKTGFQVVRFLNYDGGNLAAPLSELFVDRAVIKYVCQLLGQSAWDIGSQMIMINGWIDARDPYMVEDGGENVYPAKIKHAYISADENYTIVTQSGAMQYLNGAQSPPLSSTFMDWDIIDFFASQLSKTRQELETDLIAEFGWLDER